MKSLISSCVFMVLLLHGSTCLATNESFILLEIEDGDTLVVEVKGEPRRIQLSGMDAPEDVVNPKLQRDVERSGLSADTLLLLGKAATAQLETLAVVGKGVRLEGDLDAKDRYGRTPMLVYDEAGRLINEAMIEEGFAITSTRSKVAVEQKSRWQVLEKSAIDGRKGIWGGETRQAALIWAGRAAP